MQDRPPPPPHKPPSFSLSRFWVRKFYPLPFLLLRKIVQEGHPSPLRSPHTFHSLLKNIKWPPLSQLSPFLPPFFLLDLVSDLHFPFFFFLPRLFQEEGFSFPLPFFIRPPFFESGSNPTSTLFMPPFSP